MPNFKNYCHNPQPKLITVNTVHFVKDYVTFEGQRFISPFQIAAQLLNIILFVDMQSLTHSQTFEGTMTAVTVEIFNNILNVCRF